MLPRLENSELSLFGMLPRSENSELLECRQELKKKLKIVIHQNIVETSLSVSVIVFSEEVHLNDSANIM